MKITLSQLKRIIKEEVATVKQVGAALPAGRVRSNVPKMSADDAAEQRAIEQHCVGFVSSVVVGFDDDWYAQMASNLVDHGVDVSAEELMGELADDSAQTMAIDAMSKALIVYTKSIVSARNKLYPKDEI
jgi:hypothetical protein